MEDRIRALLLAAGSDDPIANRLAVSELAKLPSARAVPLMLQIYEQTKFDGVKRSVVRALVKIGKPAVEPLLEYLERKPNHGAILALGFIGDQRAVNSLLRLLEGSAPNDWQESALSLMMIDSARAAEAIVRHVDLRRDDHRFPDVPEDVDAVNYLLAIGEPAIQPLIERLDDKSSGWGCGLALAAFGKRAVNPLLKALKHQSPLTRMHAALALGTIKDARALKPLLSLLKDEDFDVRRRAVEALGYLGDEQALEPILQMREQLKASLALIRAPETPWGAPVKVPYAKGDKLLCQEVEPQKVRDLDLALSTVILKFRPSSRPWDRST